MADIALKKAELWEEVKASRARIKELEQQVLILEKRIQHCDIEVSQARVSRNQWQDWYNKVAEILKRHAVLPKEFKQPKSKGFAVSAKGK